MITEAAVNRLVQKWFRRLLLSDLWVITVKIHRDADECPEEHRDDEAYITITDGYDQAALTINAFRVPEGGLELAVAHEMSHLVLRELEMLAEAGAGKRMAAVVEAAVERATERFSRAMTGRKA